MSDALSPTPFLRVSFDKSVDMSSVESEIRSLTSEYGVLFDEISVEDANESDAILATHELTVVDVENVSGDVVDFEVSVAEIEGFERFDHRLSQSSDFDVPEEKVRMAFGVSESEGESLGL